MPFGKRPVGRESREGRESCQGAEDQVAGAWPDACKPCVQDRLAKAVPGRRTQACPPPGFGKEPGKRPQQMWKEITEAALSLAGTPPSPSAWGSRSDWRVGWGADLHECQGPAARLDLKCAQKTKPSQTSCWSGRSANNHTRQTSPGRHSEPGGPASGLPAQGPRSSRPCFHMCGAFLHLFRLGVGWRCTAPKRALGGCQGPSEWCSGGHSETWGENQGQDWHLHEGRQSCPSDFWLCPGQYRYFPPSHVLGACGSLAPLNLPVLSSGAPLGSTARALWPVAEPWGGHSAKHVEARTRPDAIRPGLASSALFWLLFPYPKTQEHSSTCLTGPHPRRHQSQG